MKRRKTMAQALRALCAEPHEDDGIDPRTRGRHGEARPVDRKAWQLCKQVRQAVQFALAGECGDARLRDLYVTAVEPVPDERRLCVLLQPGSDAARVAPEELLRRLHELSGFLRSRVAADISRKRTPLLEFQLLPPEEVQP